MKKYGWIVLVAAALFVPVTAQAQTCFWTMCDWLDEDFEGYSTNTQFQNGEWNPYAAALVTITDSCYNPALSNKVIELPGGGGKISKTFFVDSQVSSNTQFEVDFRMTIEDDTDNWYDVITVRVIDETASTVETFYVRASAYDTSCNDISPLVLSNNYLDHWVTVELETGYLTVTDFLIDQISFWQN